VFKSPMIITVTNRTIWWSASTLSMAALYGKEMWANRCRQLISMHENLIPWHHVATVVDLASTRLFFDAMISQRGKTKKLCFFSHQVAGVFTQTWTPATGNPGCH